MSLVSAAAAIKLFLRKLEVAQDMATAGAVGDLLDSVLSDADDLLNLIDEELADVDRERHASLFTTTPMLRRKMDQVRRALRSRNHLESDSADSRPHRAARDAAGAGGPTPERWGELIDEMLRRRT